MFHEIWLLFLLIFGFFIGPFLYSIWPQKNTWYNILDGFSVTSVGGIALLHLFPEAIIKGGFIAVLGAILGFFFPLIIEKIASVQKEKSGFFILMIALAIHTALESSAINNNESNKHLGLAIVLHRLPVGLILFSSARLVKGNILGYFSIIFLSIITLLGFFFGKSIFNSIGFSFSLLESFVAASLLHIIIEHKLDISGRGTHKQGIHCSHTHDNHCHHNHEQGNFFSGIGAILGIILVVAIVGQPSIPQISPDSYTFLKTFMVLALESAPALLLAYFLAGVLKGFFHLSKVTWLKKGSSFSQSIKGVLFGIPLPICSCGILPLYKTFTQQGIPTTAAIAFLIATPELGLDAILLSLPLLGKEFTLYRLFSAFFISIFTALILGKIINKNGYQRKEHINPPVESKSFIQKMKDGFQFGFIELFDHTTPWILLGLFIAAIAEPLLDYRLLYNLPSFMFVPIFTLIGVPIYVCASGATPIAAILIHKGISAGAALAFLIAGPATNITTFALLSHLHNRRVALIFAIVVAVTAIGLGWIVDGITSMDIRKLHHAPESEPGFVQWGSFIILIFLFILSLLRLGPRGLIKQIVEPIH